MYFLTFSHFEVFSELYWGWYCQRNFCFRKKIQKWNETTVRFPTKRSGSHDDHCVTKPNTDKKPPPAMKSQSSLNNKHINKSIFGGDSMYFAVPDYWRLYCYHLYKNIKYYCSVFLLWKLSTGDSYESAFLRKVNPYLDQNCKNT